MFMKLAVNGGGCGGHDAARRARCCEARTCLRPGAMGEEKLRGLASGGGPVPLRFAFRLAAEGLPEIGEARRGGHDVGRSRQRIRLGFDERLEQFGGGNARFLKRVVVIEQPAGQKGLGRLLDPLIEQGADFAAQVGRVIEPRQFKTLEGSGGRLPQVVQRRNDSRYSHGYAPKK